MLRFLYQDEPLVGPGPPTLPVGTVVRWRPLLPVSITGPTRLVRDFGGADDTVFPLDTARRLGVPLHPDTGHRVRWRGQLHPLRFGAVELLLTDDGSVLRWPAVVGFSPAPLRYPILGQAGCLHYLDARFLGADLVVELETNRTYPGTKT